LFGFLFGFCSGFVRGLFGFWGHPNTNTEQYLYHPVQTKTTTSPAYQ
jgi:uncharacterized membrane protein YfcA